MVDSTSDFTDNISNNGNDDGAIVVDMRQQEPLNDPNCEHFFVKDSDTIGDNQAWICQKCKRGTFLPKHMSITNSS